MPLYEIYEQTNKNMITSKTDKYDSSNRAINGLL